MTVSEWPPIRDPAQIQISMRPKFQPSCDFSSTDLMRCLKLTIFGLNIVLSTIGGILIALSSYALYFVQQERANADDVYSTSHEPGSFFAQASSYLIILVLTAGVITLLIGLLGCCGVANNDQSSLYIHCGVLLVLLLFELSSLCAFAWSERMAPRRAETAVLRLIRRSPDRSAAAWAVVHAVQRQFRCCGVLGYRDYTALNASIPLSCCRIDAPSLAALERCDFAGKSDRQLEVHPLLRRRGCSRVVRRRLQAVAVFGYTMSGLVVLIQMVAFSLSCYVAVSLRENERAETFDGYV